MSRYESPLITRRPVIAFRDTFTLAPCGILTTIGRWCSLAYARAAAVWWEIGFPFGPNQVPCR